MNVELGVDLVGLRKQAIDETLRLGGIAIWLMREATQDVPYEGAKEQGEIGGTASVTRRHKILCWRRACTALDGYVSALLTNHSQQVDTTEGSSQVVLPIGEALERISDLIEQARVAGSDQ